MSILTALNTYNYCEIPKDLNTITWQQHLPMHLPDRTTNKWNNKCNKKTFRKSSYTHKINYYTTVRVKVLEKSRIKLNSWHINLIKEIKNNSWSAPRLDALCVSRYLINQDSIFIRLILDSMFQNNYTLPKLHGLVNFPLCAPKVCVRSLYSLQTLSFV